MKAKLFAQNPITIEALGQVLTSVGLSATLLLFFVWWLYNSQQALRKETVERETRIAGETQLREQVLIDDFKVRYLGVVDRLQKVEDFQRDTMMNLVKETSVALGQNTVALQNNTVALERAAKSSEATLTAVHVLHEDLKAHHKLAVDVSEKMAAEKRGMT